MTSSLLYRLTQKLQADVLSNVAIELFAHCANPLRAAKRVVKSLERQRLVVTYTMMVTKKMKPTGPLIERRR